MYSYCFLAVTLVDLPIQQKHDVSSFVIVFSLREVVFLLLSNSSSVTTITFSWKKCRYSGLTQSLPISSNASPETLRHSTHVLCFL
mmetsp:Transcript_30489/g.45401  ORF Transcript_30489/g.45401 Transcript_30489/m.45401 type:complete len:86 (-) Transcript_30489:736-993(-)